jgi:hypothetical protein
VAANARYAQCQHSQDGIQMWLFQAMGAFGGSTAPAFSNTKNVGALAVATRASAQSTCPVPLAIKPKAGGVAPNYGYLVGEWVNMIGKSNVGNGEMGWYNLDGSNSASETKNLPSLHGVGPGWDTLGTPGAQTTRWMAWELSLGIYKNMITARRQSPGHTRLCLHREKLGRRGTAGCYSGTKAAGSDPTAANFLTKRLAFASYDDTGTSINGGDAITGLNTNSFKKLATPGPGTGAAHEHNQYGYSRRIVTVPVINGATQVIDYLCMFMLQPLSGPTATVQLEFRGNAGNVSSPCTTSGLAGGTAGPKVPVLVQ